MSYRARVKTREPFKGLLATYAAIKSRISGLWVSRETEYARLEIPTTCGDSATGTICAEIAEDGAVVFALYVRQPGGTTERVAVIPAGMVAEGGQA